MKTLCLLTLLALLPMSCLAGNSKIHGLAEKLSHPPRSVFPWDEGMFEAVALPRNAKPAQVLARSIHVYGIRGGMIQRYKILAVESVTIPISSDARNPDPKQYEAVLIDSDRGQVIMLMRYTGRDWWTRPYEVK